MNFLLRRNTRSSEEINLLLKYYQEFHHTCVTWYITVMGFFIAGLIASNKAPSCGISTAVLVISFILGVSFFMCIFHYGARIKVLNSYLEDPRIIPLNWQKAHKNQRLCIEGVGSYFFLTILVIMQVAVWWLTLAFE